MTNKKTGKYLPIAFSRTAEQFVMRYFDRDNSAQKLVHFASKYVLITKENILKSDYSQSVLFVMIRNEWRWPFQTLLLLMFIELS